MMEVDTKSAEYLIEWLSGFLPAETMQEIKSKAVKDYKNFPLAQFNYGEHIMEVIFNNLEDR